MKRNNDGFKNKIYSRPLKSFVVHNFHFFGQQLVEISGLPRGGKEGLIAGVSIREVWGRT